MPEYQSGIEASNYFCSDFILASNHVRPSLLQACLAFRGMWNLTVSRHISYCASHIWMKLSAIVSGSGAELCWLRSSGEGEASDEETSGGSIIEIACFQL